MIASPNNLVWMDLEMTGLEPDHDTIIEIATIITDGELNILAEGPNIVIHQPDEALDAMDEWNTTHHGESGLTARVRASRTSMAVAEQKTLDFIRKYVPEGSSPLCGNSIHQDRRFLVRYMPKLESYVHYRNIDVSTIKELAKRWYPDDKAPIKQAEHQALSDIRESINELIWYRQHIFRQRRA
ncbi:oligoribonuclease [Mariprofundus ferrooxydans]|uniref:Oligoribonuclease n=1 Tax=Mariprofundus ferrooxydans PV-1 TaxID=314345 RepID=Q0F066_9PROT|nr:oligoribonuclease [Mariprofundus ferrooxydans]EAU54818.1 oligoribonuclease [Mariprofundus ferrooxydans PV-1]KON46538.1 oligoribonuclease [Mariprofundus ferrooxydans]